MSLTWQPFLASMSKSRSHQEYNMMEFSLQTQGSIDATIAEGLDFSIFLCCKHLCNVTQKERLKKGASDLPAINNFGATYFQSNNFFFGLID